jgi:hypothetical protein
VVWGLVSCLPQLYGLAFWGCTIPLRGGGFDGELTPLAWAAGWRQLLGRVQRRWCCRGYLLGSLSLRAVASHCL